jgi:hypothetical protein
MDFLKDEMILKLKDRDKMRFRGKYEAGVENHLVETERTWVKSLNAKKDVKTRLRRELDTSFYRCMHVCVKR